MANEATSKMWICLWKGCGSVFEEAAAFQEHVTKHGQELNCDNDNHATKEEEAMWKKAEDKKMANQTEHEESKIVFLAIEVWVDVFGFIKRIQLARTISLTNRHIHQICLPRLHGDKVKGHEIERINIDSLERMTRPPKAFVLRDDKALPIPSCPPPPYISGFCAIGINFLDQRVLAFLTRICPCIAKNVAISLYNEPDGKKHALLDQLLNIIVKEASQIVLSSFFIDEAKVLIQSIPDLVNKVLKICLYRLNKESERAILMEMLASSRPDGKQHVFCVYGKEEEKILEAIKKEFHASTQPVPQPFCIYMWHPINIECEEQNELTNETLIVSYNGCMRTNDRATYNIYRHPKGQHEQWREDATKRLCFPANERTTSISVELWLLRPSQCFDFNLENLCGHGKEYWP